MSSVNIHMCTKCRADLMEHMTMLHSVPGREPVMVTVYACQACGRLSAGTKPVQRLRHVA
jgi:C4-type Zn-finger protein